MAGALAAFTLAVFVRAHRNQLLLLAAILAVFAFDDVMVVHERVGGKTAVLLGIEADYMRAFWPVLYFPLLCFVFVALWQLAGPLLATATRAIRLGLGFLVAAVGAEALSLTWHVASGHIGDWPDTIEVAIEEGLELSGWILIASGLTAVALTRLGFVRRDGSRRLASNETAPAPSQA